MNWTKEDTETLWTVIIVGSAGLTLLGLLIYTLATHVSCSIV